MHRPHSAIDGHFSRTTNESAANRHSARHACPLCAALCAGHSTTTLLCTMKRLDPQSHAARNLASGRYAIRSMSQREIDEILIPRMRNAGWNTGVHDAASFVVAHPDGFSWENSMASRSRA